SFLVMFPLSYLSFMMSKSYNISTQTFSLWMKDKLIDFWIEFAISFIVITVLYALIRKFKKRWWLGAWILSVSFSIFMMFIQPLLIDPLANAVTPLEAKQLEVQRLEFADKANIPADHVYEVDMSSNTNSMHRYVRGVGSNSRIVIWDTTLEH